MTTAVVVGSAPNGQAAAVTLVREGVEVTESEIGGGARSGELTIPGVLHDHCSAVHPMAVESPFRTDSASTARPGAGCSARSATDSTSWSRTFCIR